VRHCHERRAADAARPRPRAAATLRASADSTLAAAAPAANVPPTVVPVATGDVEGGLRRASASPQARALTARLGVFALAEGARGAGRVPEFLFSHPGDAGARPPRPGR